MKGSRQLDKLGGMKATIAVPALSFSSTARHLDTMQDYSCLHAYKIQP